ncbi:uncharacterized protein LOC112090343 [Morus notabilis]|uniref:uncharacterized protein LOC112090343 n=1 Tax=Morus notabilis TaxID=981085 RepID=UPI000CED20F6|nr:uncharacterized protein LOC112090343 [Morus notabilis]
MGSSESGSYSRKRSSLERIPSSVRNMISAFESNLSQDTKSHIKPSPPTKVQSNKIGSQSKEAKTENTETMRGSVQLEELSTTKVRGKGTNNTSTKSKLKFTHKELATEEEKSHGDSTRTPMITTSSAVDNVSDRQHSSKSQTKISSETSPSFTMREITTHNLRPVEHYEDMHDSFDSFSAWIFPDQMRRFCVTTGGKKLMDFVGGYGSIKSEVRQGKVNISIPEKSNDNGGTRNEIKRSKKTHKARKSKPESEDVESSTGPVGQLVKVAIMVGFGVLVLLTRQRNNR